MFAGALLARPALAQATSDLAVTLTPPSSAKSVGQSVTYRATVVNQGISNAHNSVLTGTLPAGAQFVSGAGCVEGDAGTFTCALGEIADAGTGGLPVAVTFAIAPSVPNPLPSTLPDCVNAATLGNVTVQVSTTTTDVNAANDTASAVVQVKPYTDLSIDLTGPGSVDESSTAEYVGSVTNNGPCPAENVEVDTNLSFPVLSTTGACTAIPCMIGTLAVGQTVQFHSVFATPKIDGLTGAALAANFSVTSDAIDPNPGNDVASSQATYNLSSGGCNSGGAGGLLALASVIGLLRRRRIV